MGAKFQTALRKVASVAGAVLAALIVVGWWANSLFAPFMIHRVPLDNEYSAQEPLALDGHISCISYSDWHITAVQGPCSDSKPLAKLAIGQHFLERGVDHEIRIILATHVEKDYPEEKLKAGDWYCEAAESEADLDHEGKQWRRTWLLVEKCQPTSQLNRR